MKKRLSLFKIIFLITKIFCVLWLCLKLWKQNTFHIYFSLPFQGVFLCVLVAQLWLALCDPMDYSPSDSSAQGILQDRMLEWVAMPSSRGSSRSRDWTRVCCIAGRFFTIWATRKPPSRGLPMLINLVLANPWCSLMLWFCFHRWKEILRILVICQRSVMLLLLLSRFSCVQLCNPIGGVAGFSVPGILQARTLDWVAISLPNACMPTESIQSCSTLWDPKDSSPPGSSVHRIL